MTASTDRSDPQTIVIAYPPAPAEELLDRVRAACPDARLIACVYEEDEDRRAARRRSESENLTPMELTPEQVTAWSTAEVALAFDLPSNLAAVAPKLRWIQGIGAGIEHWHGVTMPDGVILTSAAGVASVPIAEFVMGRLLAIWKRFDELARRQRDHEWRSTFGRVVAGRTIGLIGFGAIGSEIARRARAFDMKVIAVRRSGATSPLADEVFGPDDLDAVLARCDAVVVSAPATPETRDLFDAQRFAAMRPGALFCNVARGTLVVESDLVAALESGHLGGAIIDVVRAEPLPATSALWDAPRIWISPHSAASPERYFEVLFDLFADNLERFATGVGLGNVIDSARGY